MQQQVAITKLAYTGREVYRYSGWLEQVTDECIAVRCAWDKLPPTAVGELLFERSDILVEYFYYHRWFNIFSLFTLGGQLKGWYCNTAEPTLITPRNIRWRDLELDLVVMPDGQQTVLDEDEFAAAALGETDRQQALTALGELRRRASVWHAPFDTRELGRSFPCIRAG